MTNTKKPLVSIILSIFNDEKFIKQSVNCLLRQNYKNIEIIIINDGSTDNTQKILEVFEKKYKNIFLINNKKNIGLTKSLNIGIKRSKGKYIARQDCDDISYTKRISEQVNVLEKDKEIAMCGTQRIILDKRASKTYRDYLPLEYYQIRKKALLSNPFFHSSVMVRKSIFRKVGAYNEKFKYVQDLELWSRIIFRYKTVNLKDILCKKYISKERISFNKKKFFIRNICSFKARLSIYKNGKYTFLDFFIMLFFFIKSL